MLLLRRMFAVASLATLSLFGGACSVLSGWSDLQDGLGDAAARGNDGGTTDGTAPAVDSAAAVDAAMPPSDTDVVCGAARCPSGQGCCADPSRDTLMCAAKSACTDGILQFYACTSAAACPASAPVCCYDFSKNGASCVAGCGAGGLVLCNPADSDPCSHGTKCVGTAPGSRQIPACQ